MIAAGTTTAPEMLQKSKNIFIKHAGKHSQSLLRYQIPKRTTAPTIAAAISNLFMMTCYASVMPPYLFENPTQMLF
jgi:hypothetical protein